jgi:hypothetical protein
MARLYKEPGSLPWTRSEKITFRGDSQLPMLCVVQANETMASIRSNPTASFGVLCNTDQSGASNLVCMHNTGIHDSQLFARLERDDPFDWMRRPACRCGVANASAKVVPSSLFLYQREVG